MRDPPARESRMRWLSVVDAEASRPATVPRPGHPAPAGTAIDPVLLVAPADCGPHGVAVLAAWLESLVHAGACDVIVDGRRIETMDGTLPRLLLQSHALLGQQGGALAIVAGPRTVLARSALAVLGGAIEVFPTIEAAFDLRGSAARRLVADERAPAQPRWAAQAATPGPAATPA